VTLGGSIEPFDPADDGHVAALHQLQFAFDRESLPGDPPIPLEEFVDDVRVAPRFRESRRWIMRGDSEHIVAMSELSIDHVEDNQHIATAWVGVHPDARREGRGVALLKPVVESAEAAGRSVLDSWAITELAGEPFLTEQGFERRYLERHSRLRISDLDQALMKEWVARAEERATGYSLVGWDGPCPDDLVEGYANVLHVMNTAPTEALDWEDEVFTPDRIRAKEDAWERAGQDWWVLVARHDETGDVAGLTEVGFRPHRPWFAVQGNTGVDPRHREKGLGRWLKSAMILRLVAEHPEVECVDTWNANSNRPMLNINEAMGFRPLRYIGGWQAPLEVVARRIAAAE